MKVASLVVLFIIWFPRKSLSLQLGCYKEGNPGALMVVLRKQTTTLTDGCTLLVKATLAELTDSAQ